MGRRNNSFRADDETRMGDPEMILYSDRLKPTIRTDMEASEREREPIYVFQIDDKYLFSHYFHRTDIFSELRMYYNDDEYRFEVPEDDFPRVLELLEQNRYDPIRVEDLEEFAVVKEQYTEHKDILRNSLMHWSRDGYNFFLMQSPQAVEKAVEQGATRLEEIDLALGL